MLLGISYFQINVLMFGINNYVYLCEPSTRVLSVYSAQLGSSGGGLNAHIISLSKSLSQWRLSPVFSKRY